MSKTQIPAGGVTDGILTSAKLDQDGAFTFNEGSADVDFRVETNSNANMLFISGGNNVVGIGAEGDLGAGLHIKSADSGAGANSSADELVVEGSADSGISILSGASSSGTIAFGDSGDDNVGVIFYDHGSNLMGFAVGGAEAMRVDSGGHLIVNGTAGITGTSLMVYNDTTESTAQFVNKATTGNHRGIDFNDGDDTLLGSINFNCGGNTVSFETSSDYRLKENVTDLTGAITRVKNLKPKRFNFKTRPDETIDGFLAHEVQSVIPEAASGTKDETETRKNVVVNAKGNVKACDITEAEWIEGKSNGVFPNNTEWFASKDFIRPQGVDQSKLVPLLTKALQEAITKIETLETKVKALEDA